MIVHSAGESARWNSVLNNVFKKTTTKKTPAKAAGVLLSCRPGGRSTQLDYFRRRKLIRDLYDFEHMPELHPDLTWSGLHWSGLHWSGLA